MQLDIVSVQNIRMRKVEFQLKSNNSTNKKQKITRDAEISDDSIKTNPVLTMENSKWNGQDENQNVIHDVLVIPLIRTASRLTENQLCTSEGIEKVSLENPPAANFYTKISTDMRNVENPSEIPRRAPLLIANSAPELLHIKNEDQKFKVDLSLRAEDVTASSDVYKSVPVDQFGAAILRGMGWQGGEDGAKKENEEKIVPREGRLGLGALSKPSANKNGKKTNKPSNLSEWKQKADKKLQQQVLQDNDLVWIRNVDHAGKRAQIIQARGVPGLNKVRVELEAVVNDGDTQLPKYLILNKSEVVKLSVAELEQAPFQYHPNKKDTNPDSVVGQKQEIEYFGLKTAPMENKVVANETKDSEQKTAVKHNLKVKAPLSLTKTEHWIRDGIRVKIISEKAAGERYLSCKGMVIDVPSPGIANIRIEKDNRLIEGVKEKYLETVLPHVNGACILLATVKKELRAYVGETATLIEKHRELQQVTIQLNSDLNVIVVDMDHIASLS